MCCVQREREREGERGGFARIYTVLSEYVRSRTFFLPASGEYASESFFRMWFCVYEVSGV